MDLLAPHYLVFDLPFLAALFYTLLLVTGTVGSHESDTDVDHDVDVAVESDLDHDMDADAGVDAIHALDHDADHDMDHDQDHDNDGDAGESVLMRVLGFFGVGKVPISILITSFCYIWGVSGWASNVILGGFIPYPAIYFLPSLGIAAFCSMFLTRYFALLVGKIMPKSETYLVTKASLVGRTGIIRYDTSERTGEVQVFDIYNSLHSVECRVMAGQEEIPQGTSVVLTSYNETEGFFTVEREDAFDARIRMPMRRSS